MRREPTGDNLPPGMFPFYIEGTLVGIVQDLDGTLAIKELTKWGFVKAREYLHKAPADLDLVLVDGVAFFEGFSLNIEWK